jgi:hypothetical protein
MKKQNGIKILINGFSKIQLLFLLILVYILFYFVEIDDTYDESIKTRSIPKDGFCVLYNPKYASSVGMNGWPSQDLERDILQKLPSGYAFIDYIYKINNVSLSTFHRDVTSSQHIYKTNYPVYTVILYKYDGELLSICPGSNLSYPLVLSRIVNIDGKSGTTFLFNSDILHAGRINNCEKREVLQYKVCHKSDLVKLVHLTGTRIDKTDICEISYWNLFLRKMSYYFEMPINYLFYPLMIQREKQTTIVGKIQNYIPIQFYNNTTKK